MNIKHTNITKIKNEINNMAFGDSLQKENIDNLPVNFATLLM